MKAYQHNAVGHWCAESSHKALGQGRNLLLRRGGIGRMMKKIFVAMAALMIPLTMIGVAGAAPERHKGEFVYDAAASDPVISYPTTGNSNVKNAYFDVYALGMKNSDRSGLRIKCYDDDRLVYDAQSTIAYGNFVREDHPVSFYVSLSTVWRGERALCDVELIWETWNRKDLHQFGGVMYSQNDVFWIGE